MNKPIRTLTLNGVTKTVHEWSVELDIPPSTIHNRMERGISDQECLMPTEDKPKVSKNDAEWALNDMTRDQLPSALAKLIPPDYKGHKVGETIRRNHRKAFDDWFERVYVPNHSKRP